MGELGSNMHARSLARSAALRAPQAKTDARACCIEERGIDGIQIVMPTPGLASRAPAASGGIRSCAPCRQNVRHSETSL